MIRDVVAGPEKSQKRICSYQDHKTPLHKAVDSGDVESFKCLLSRTPGTDFIENNKSAVEIVLRSHYETDADFINYLLQNGYKPEGKEHPIAASLASHLETGAAFLRTLSSQYHRGEWDRKPKDYKYAEKQHYKDIYTRIENVTKLIEAGADIRGTYDSTLNGKDVKIEYLTDMLNHVCHFAKNKKIGKNFLKSVNKSAKACEYKNHL